LWVSVFCYSMGNNFNIFPLGRQIALWHVNFQPSLLVSGTVSQEYFFMKYVVLPTKIIVSCVANNIIFRQRKMLPRILMALIYSEYFIYSTVSKIHWRNSDESRYTFHLIVRLILLARNML
jgi:hypothetical protein